MCLYNVLKITLRVLKSNLKSISMFLGKQWQKYNFPVGLFLFSCRHRFPNAPQCFSKRLCKVGETGLVVTRASCYSCVFSETRRQQEFSVISDEKHFKPTLHAKFGDHMWQQEKVMAKQHIFTSPSNFFYIFDNSSCAKKYTSTSGN